MINVVLLDEGAKAPEYQHRGDAGADLFSIENVDIFPGQWKLVRTGISLAIPEGYVGLIHPRSGLAVKYGVTVLNTPGTIDSGYRGEIKVNLINHGSDVFAVSRGDRIAQLVIQEVVRAAFGLASELSISDRGTDGHGSTGGYVMGWDNNGIRSW